MIMSTSMSWLLVLAVVLAATTTPVAASRHRQLHAGGESGFERILEAQEADRVERLPGQPAEVGFRHFSGYVTVNETHGRALFYWLLEATHEVAKKPLVLWLNGGPGCSSLGNGAMLELGPFLVRPQAQLSLNPHSWNKDANLLFLESPAGVGFSYTNTTSDLHGFGDQLTAHDAYTFLVKWFERFPQFKGHDFYIAGESYAGHYVPQLAEKIMDKNSKLHKSRRINFKGIMIGNADLDDEAGDRGTVDYAWHHAIISDELYAAINKDCDFSADGPASPACIRDFDAFYAAMDGLDVYSLYTPLCTTNINKTPARRLPLRRRAAPNNNLRGGLLRHGGYDPCREHYAAEYLNRRDVQEALHANATGAIPYRWAECSDTLFRHWNWDDSPASMLPVVRKMVDAGLRVWVYSGDTDSVVPVTSTRYALRKLGLPTVKQWREWFTSDQVGGYTVVYDGGLTFVTVRGAGHMVPTITPVQARQLFAHFLAGKELPHKPVVA